MTKNVVDGLVMKYFVLNPTKHDEYGIASRTAILTYAKSIEEINPYLAADLRNWIDDLGLKNYGKP